MGKTDPEPLIVVCDAGPIIHLDELEPRAPAAVEDGGVRFVEVEMPSMAASARAKPVATGGVVAELVLPGGACVRFFGREGAC